mmetsp:Transcript_54861/g.158708  ORF Transcript_54861/g.158708 Transcript_54861/m.158708 type:complete len:993 (+) Transcript_54861:204-3182(+)
MSEECSVQVGIRIRPFNDREKKLGAQLCVDVDGATTILQNPPDVAAETGKGAEAKRFTFDASFWSHDGFEELPNGYCKALEGSKYADQRMVFEAFGKKVLDNAWEGYHCCLFAYGQTGAGKSYSMVGYGANKGIVPTSCEEIFMRISANDDPGLSFEVMVSMVEIYNEQVQDLLVAAKDRPKKGLEIRESQQLGIYIDGVMKRAVDSYKAIEGVMEEGTMNRTVGSTLMNATSSRAHTVITIEFKQVSTLEGGVKGSKVSMINLVDLAGSEKAGQTGASGDRLKEGCAINKSLSALGNVIEKLADKAMGKAKNVVVPYRDSKLTRLLQNALGGSSKTIMICAISPASSNYEETLSTLRYADRAKRIKNSASINENPQDKLIRQLREENEKLRQMIGQSPGGGGGEADAEEMAAKQSEIAALEQALQEMQKSFAERLAEAQSKATEAAQEKKKTEDIMQPHIANLNEDDLLTNKLRFMFHEGTTRIGRPTTDGDEAPEVALSAPGIMALHAVVAHSGGECTLSAIGEGAATTFVNGVSLEGKDDGLKLSHGDRVAFGQCYFVFIVPSAGKASDLLESGKVSYAMARKELAEAQGEMGGASEEELKASREMAEELERKVKEAQEAKDKAQQEADELLRQREEEFKAQMEKRQAEWIEEQAKAKSADEMKAAEDKQKHAEELARLQQEFVDKQRSAEAAAARRIQELEAAAKKAAAEEEEHRHHEQAMQRLEEELMFVMPLVKEANLIAQELKRPHRLETKMHCDLTAGKRTVMRVMACVHKENVRLFEWTPETLENRVFLLRELLQRCEEEGFEIVEGLSDEDDPLWDPVEVERLIGCSQVLLEGVLLQVEHAFDARILSTEGHTAGTLRVEISPMGRDGTVGVPDDEVVDDPEELLGTRLAVQVHVVKASQLPEALANDVRIEFNYFIDDRPHQVPMVAGHNENPVFDYTKVFVQDPVTSRFLEYLQQKLVFRVYGKDAKAIAEQEAAAAAAA